MDPFVLFSHVRTTHHVDPPFTTSIGSNEHSNRYQLGFCVAKVNICIVWTHPMTKSRHPELPMSPTNFTCGEQRSNQGSHVAKVNLSAGATSREI